MSVACDVNIKDEIKEEPLNFEQNSKDDQLFNNETSDLEKSQCSADPIEAIYLPENIKEEKLDVEAEEEEEEEEKNSHNEASKVRTGFADNYFKKMDRQTIDSEQLIEQIRARPAIWDMSSKEYNDKVLKKKIWEELATMFASQNATLEEKKLIGERLMKKWKAVRDNFVREHRKTETEAPATKRKKYVYFDQLLFLLPHLKNSENTVSNIPPPEVTFHVDSSTFTADQSDHDHQQHQQHSLLTQDFDDGSKCKRRKLKRLDGVSKKGAVGKSLAMTTKHLTDILQESVSLQREERNSDRYGNKAFMLSFVPIMDNLPQHIFLEIRKRVADIFNNLSTNRIPHNPQSSSFSYRSSSSSSSSGTPALESVSTVHTNKTTNEDFNISDFVHL